MDAQMDAQARVAELLTECARALDRPSPNLAPRSTTRERFVAFYQRYERLFGAAIDAGIAVAHAPVRPDRELDELARALGADDAALLDLLWGGLEDGLSYIGTDEGYFYGGQPWEELCVVRSALTFLAELAGIDDVEMSAEARSVMDHWAVEMFRPLEPPSRLPTTHWWWWWWYETPPPERRG